MSRYSSVLARRASTRFCEVLIPKTYPASPEKHEAKVQMKMKAEARRDKANVKAIGTISPSPRGSLSKTDIAAHNSEKVDGEQDDDKPAAERLECQCKVTARRTQTAQPNHSQSA